MVSLQSKIRNVAAKLRGLRNQTFFSIVTIQWRECRTTTSASAASESKADAFADRCFFSVCRGRDLDGAARGVDGIFIRCVFWCLSPCFLNPITPARVIPSVGAERVYVLQFVSQTLCSMDGCGGVRAGACGFQSPGWVELQTGMLWLYAGGLRCQSDLGLRGRFAGQLRHEARGPGRITEPVTRPTRHSQRRSAGS